MKGKRAIWLQCAMWFPGVLGVTKSIPEISPSKEDGWN